MTGQQAFDEAIRRLDQARNEYISNVPPTIETGDFTKSYFETGHPLELGAPFGSRSDQVRVDFPLGRFSKPPTVQVMLSKIDADHAINTRVLVDAINVTQSGFILEIKTWADSKVYGVGVTWIAVVE